MNDKEKKSIKKNCEKESLLIGSQMPIVTDIYTDTVLILLLLLLLAFEKM